MKQELTDWALVREKVLEKLDMRAAHRARQLSLELWAIASRPEESTESEEELSDLLEACHALLEQQADLAEDAAPPESGVCEVGQWSAGPRSRLGEGLPVLHDDLDDPEETAPGTRRAALARASSRGARAAGDGAHRLASLAFDDEEESEATRAGVPRQVMESYLAEVRSGSHG